MNSLLNLIKSTIRKESAPEPFIGKNLADAYNQSRSGSGHKCFCHAPFTNMLFSQSGSVHVCCHNLEFSIGKYPEQSLKEIWNSTKANELKGYMRRYDLSHGCGICEADLKMGSFQEVRASHFDRIPKHPDYPTMMEFLVSNQCNLECVMCKGEYSSLIRKNREKLPPLITPYDDEFVKQLEEFIPYLYETRFSGSGEAFSIDVNYKIWGNIIKKNPKCIIMVQTNGTILTDRVKDILSRGNFQIGVSLDSLNKETYEAIRLNANFEKVMDNIRYFKNYCDSKNIKFSLAMCAMRQNWRELPGFINFCNSLNSVATLHKVWYPRRYALHNLAQEQLREIYSYLSDYDFPAETPRQLLNRDHYRYFVSVVKSWAEAPVKFEEIKLKPLTFNELFEYLSKKMKDEIVKSNVPEQEKDRQLTLIKNKLTTMLNMFEDKQEREEILRMISVTPLNLLLPAFKNQAIQDLFDQARKHWKEEFATQ